MKYEITDYQGNKITVPTDKAQAVADIAELIEVTVAGQTHYINPKNIASIKPVPGVDVEPRLAIEAPDYRGQDSPAKEKIRQQFTNTET